MLAGALVAPASAARHGTRAATGGPVRVTSAAVDSGSAHALLMLAHALESAKPGEKIVVAQFGQGCDALLFEMTPAIADLPKRGGVSGALARRKEETNYLKYLAFNGLIELEKGYDGRRPRTWVTLTKTGGTALRDELAALKALIRQLER